MKTITANVIVTENSERRFFIGFFGKEKESKPDQPSGTAATIKILGSGCRNCRALLQNTKDAVSSSDINANVEYITDMKEVAKYGVMSMPALVVNDQVVSMGKVLKAADIQKLLNKIGIA